VGAKEKKGASRRRLDLQKSNRMGGKVANATRELTNFVVRKTSSSKNEEATQKKKKTPKLKDLINTTKNANGTQEINHKNTRWHRQTPTTPERDTLTSQGRGEEVKT